MSDVTEMSASVGGPGDDSDDDWSDDYEQPEAIEVEITDELDLHNFAPREVSELVGYYVDECIERRFARVRIIHGKGRGTLRRTVHAALERHPGVERYQLADERGGSWGATWAWLRLPPPTAETAPDGADPGTTT